MKRVGVLAVAMAVLFPGGASAALLETSVDSGRSPFATVTEILDPPKRAPRIEVTAAPAEPVEVSIEVICANDAGNRGREYRIIRRAPISHRIKLTIRKADYCIVGADATYADDYEAAKRGGRLTLRLYG